MRAFATIAALLFALGAKAQVAQKTIRQPDLAAGQSAAVTLGTETVRLSACTFTTASCLQYGIDVQPAASGTTITMTADRYGEYPRKRLSATANAYATWAMAPAGVGGGAMFPTYGFTFTYRVGFPVASDPAQTAFVGLYEGNTALPTGASPVVPSNVLNTVYLGFDAAATTWSVCSNDGVGTATCSSTGVAITATGMFEFTISTIDGTRYTYRFRKLDDDAGFDVGGTLTSDLPAVTSPVRAILWLKSSSVPAVTAIIEPSTFYLALPY